MSDQIKIEYKGFTIALYGDEWTLMQGKDHLGYSNEALAKVKAKADRIILEEKRFPPIPCIVNERHEPYRAEITSVADDGALWIRKSAGTRSKVRSDTVFSLCAENLEVIAASAKKKEEASKMNKDAEAMIKKLTPLNDARLKAAITASKTP